MLAIEMTGSLPRLPQCYKKMSQFVSKCICAAFLTPPGVQSLRSTQNRVILPSGRRDRDHPVVPTTKLWLSSSQAKYRTRGQWSQSQSLSSGISYIQTLGYDWDVALVHPQTHLRLAEARPSPPPPPPPPLSLPFRPRRIAPKIP